MEYVIHALLTADKVIEENNGKKAIIGVFENIHAESFPSQAIPPWNIYASIANLARGKHQIAINLVYDKSNAAIFSMSGEIQVNEQGPGVEIVAPVAIMFPGEGTYTVSLHIDGDVALSRVIRANVLSASAGGARRE